VPSASDDEMFGGEQHRDDSENEDLRGVIDDLTVENKRLKMLLKTARSLPSSSSSEARAQDRLFDLRVHGLSVSKKRELESLLRNFATSLHATSNPSSSATHGSGSGAMQSTSADSSSVPVSQPRTKSTLLPTDSGYASNSTSGMNTATHTLSGQHEPRTSKRARTTNIQNYLHDIPDTLLPKPSPTMSKRAKMALVVRRLENLFTGRVAAPGDHSQPNQQQEVSRLAAHADDPASRTRGAEGSREAHMLPQDTKVNLDAFERENPSPPLKKPRLGYELSTLSEGHSTAPSRPGSPAEQRPTRPLDLDIHRAQVADENIQYLRHLGMSSPQVIVPNDKSGSESRWVYLNLLISMAQLHTINVTPSFIRQAIRKLSTKFQLSTDGHKVRWIGGPGATVFSKEEEQAMIYHDPNPAELNDDTGGTSSKRSKTNSSSNNLVSEEPSSEDKTSALNTSDASKPKVSTAATSNMLTEPTRSKTAVSPFDYKPLVYKGRRYSPAISYLESSNSSHSNSNDSSGLVHALSKSNLNRRKSDDGMITFYQNPYFCADLSADHAPTNWVAQRKALPWDTLGLIPDSLDESPLRHHDACYFTPQFAPKAYQPGPNEQDLHCDMPPVRSGGEIETLPHEFVVCGIGGVVPEDNFALDVKILRKVAGSQRPKLAYNVPFTGSRKRKRYVYEVDDCDKYDLQPSRLPPPSYVFFTASSSSDDPDMLDMSDSDETSSEAAEINAPPPAFLNQWSTESDDDSDDMSSVDMLEMARAADPDRVAAQEREFLLNQATTRRIEGSLAATVGGSRFGSSRGGNEVPDRASSMDVDDSDSSDEK
jgi:hypothetical protein